MGLEDPPEDYEVIEQLTNEIMSLREDMDAVVKAGHSMLKMIEALQDNDSNLARSMVDVAEAMTVLAERAVLK